MSKHLEQHSVEDSKVDIVEWLQSHFKSNKHIYATSPTVFELIKLYDIFEKKIVYSEDMIDYLYAAGFNTKIVDDVLRTNIRQQSFRLFQSGMLEINYPRKT